MSSAEDGAREENSLSLFTVHEYDEERLLESVFAPSFPLPREVNSSFVGTLLFSDCALFIPAEALLRISTSRAALLGCDTRTLNTLYIVFELGFRIERAVRVNVHELLPALWMLHIQQSPSPSSLGCIHLPERGMVLRIEVIEHVGFLAKVFGPFGSRTHERIADPRVK